MVQLLAEHAVILRNRTGSGIVSRSRIAQPREDSGTQCIATGHGLARWAGKKPGAMSGQMPLQRSGIGRDNHLCISMAGGLSGQRSAQQNLEARPRRHSGAFPDNSGPVQ
jgi:hypothetical protein